MKRGIYVVANKNSQDMCENLIYSIRESGCTLPIRLIHFGGEKLSSAYVLSQVEFLQFDSFPDKAKEFVINLRSVLTDCPIGFLYRFLALFTDWEAFIYSDNDIVALCNWENLFDYMGKSDLLHADEEYTTEGIYNYDRPDLIKDFFGKSSLESAITAGHIVVRPTEKMIADMYAGIEWFKQYPHIPKKHDQSLLHVASLLGNWQITNLCRHPYNWLSSWAGDYKNSLHLIQSIQAGGAKISHVHYSGGNPAGDLAIQDLLLSAKDNNSRLLNISLVSLKLFSGYGKLSKQYYRVKKFINRKLN